ncbi:hypothetical protein [Priestia megaterium]|uniref:hypothetical protein n=1 Tax=Priestia megaterium TaxID=1404 RepID=UPI000BFDE642|nr:hypothetical protein [Priestia megaterium]PGO60573.1 hypothetical protein CN981_08470 [Priestia megaterium]
MKKTGRELLEEVFADRIEEYGEIELSEIEDCIDGVTCYEEVGFHNGWWIEYTATFRYKGKKYTFDYKTHASDNVCDSEWYEDTFAEVEEKDHPAIQKINLIIEGIENEEFETWDEIVRNLEEALELIEVK